MIFLDPLRDFLELGVERLGGGFLLEGEDKGEEDEDEAENETAQQSQHYFEFFIVHHSLLGTLEIL